MLDSVLVNGVAWFDDSGQPVNAHGGGIVFHDGRYYLFGEFKTDDENVFNGFSCYSSTDLVTWRFERLALPPQTDGLLGPDRIGERVKVMRCPSTGTFMMYAHTDDRTYTDAVIGLATSDTIDGEYTFQGAVTWNGEPLRGWDMGTFQEEDGTGYLILHEGDIFRLNEDYRSVEERVAHDIAIGGESPALFRHDDRYFLLFSNKTSWERNDNYYLSAPAVDGPWTHHGLFAPAGTLTYNSQCTFVLTRDGHPPMYMGDRWSFPHQASAASYVWLPLTIADDRLSLPEYWQAWNPTTGEQVELGAAAASVELTWTTNLADTFLDAPFTASRIGLQGNTTPHSGYARVDIYLDDAQQPLTSALVDFYSLVTDRSWRYVSPPLPQGPKRIRITNLGDMPIWFNKAGHRFGTDDTFVTVTSAVLAD